MLELETQEDIFIRWTCSNCKEEFEAIAPIFENIAGFYAAFTCESCSTDYDIPLKTR